MTEARTSKSIKVTVQAHATPWVPPEKVHFDEGLKLPIACVDQFIVQRLCLRWLDEVCTRAGMTFEVVFDITDETAE